MSKTILFSVHLLLLSALGTAGPGLWHGVDDKNGNTTFFLYLDGARSRLYTPQWVEEADLVVDEDKIQFKLPYKTYGISFKGDHKGTSITGTWEIHQVQYVVRGSWTARKVFSEPNWEPWAFLKSEGQVGDIVDIVSGQQFKSFDSFHSFWKAKIEPVYFALLTQSLYADREGDYRPVLQKGKLEKIYKFLQSEKSLSDHSRKLHEVVPEVRSDLKRKYPWIENVSVVLVFANGEFDFSPIKIGDHWFLMLGAEWSLILEDEDAMRHFVSEGLLCSFHSEILPMPARGETEVIRRSIAVYSLTQSGLESVPAPASEAGVQLEDAKKEIAKGFKLSRDDFYTTHLTGVARAKSYEVFFQFGRFLVEGQSPEKLFLLSRKDLKEGMERFFGKAKRL